MKGLVEHVAKTDGIIFHLWPKGAPIPDGSVMIAQSVGHWEAMHGMTGGAAPKASSHAPAPSSSGGSGHMLTAEDYKRIGVKETYSGR